jgi:predicted alpha/beta superfamily hydrolase
MKRIVLCLTVRWLAVGANAVAEPITIGETITIESKILGEERTILVSTPAGYERNQERYPVLYMTDGGAHLTHTRGTVDFLVRNGLMPSVIIVGINNTDRTRDLSPTHASLTNDDGTVREFPTSGGAPKFLDFFEQELFPYIESHYRTVPYRVFSGHSFGGLFALNVFFTRPHMFGAVIAVGPSLRWDDELPLRQAASFFDDRKQLDAKLFVAMANEEEGDPKPTRLDRLEQSLKQAATDGFEWRVLRMPDETHGSAVLRAHYWGLREVFDPWRLPTDPETRAFVGGLAEFKKHYDGLSQRFGFEVVPPEQQVNQTGYQFLGREDFDGAIEVFRYNVKLYPNSANVYDSLAEGLENSGNLEEALANYSRAVKNGTEIDDDALPIYTANRDRVRKLLDEAAEG